MVMDVCLLKDLYERLDIPLGTLLWKACESIPCGFVRPHTVRNGRFIFVGGGYTGNSQHSRTVFQYDLTTFIWSALAITPCHSFGLTIINDKVAILGGVNVVTSQETKTLYSYDSSGCKWCESLPPMLNIRSCHSVVNVSNNFIIVAGGIDNISRIHKDSVEILDIQNKQWFEAPPLPIGVSFMCMAASDKSVFLCGGLGESGAVCDLIMADVQTLVESAKSGVSGSDINVWKRPTKLPSVRSGCVVVQNKLVTFGGISFGGGQNNDKCNSSVFCWNEEENTWVKLGLLPFSLSSMSGITITQNKVMLIGGYTNTRSWITSLSREVLEVVNILMEQD